MMWFKLNHIIQLKDLQILSTPPIPREKYTISSQSIFGQEQGQIWAKVDRLDNLALLLYS